MRRRMAAVGVVIACVAGAGEAYAAAGSFDPGFGSGGIVDLGVGGTIAEALDVALQPDGKLVVAGYTVDAGVAVPFVRRLEPDGSPDPSFTPPALGSERIITSVAIRPDGKIVLAGWTVAGNVVVNRLNENGSLDMGFDTDGTASVNAGEIETAEGMALLPDGRIVLAGRSGTLGADAIVWRLKADGGSGAPNGALDTTFDTNGQAELNSGGTELALDVAVRSDGKLVVAGLTTNGQVLEDALVWRLKPDGGNGNLNDALDPTFETDGKAQLDSGNSEAAASVALQPDGKIVASGASSGGPGGAVATVWRLFEDGGAANTVNASLDPSFDTDGVAGLDAGDGNEARRVALQPDGKIIAVGQANDNPVVWRLNPNGGDGTVNNALDPAFGASGLVQLASGPPQGHGYAVALQPDGKIVVAGQEGASALVYRLFGDPLTVTVVRSGSGSGTVNSSPAGIGCGTVCAFGFDLGTDVTLTATPAAGSEFAGWAGAGCSGTGPCALDVQAPTTVTATFTPAADATGPPKARITRRPRKRVATRKRRARVRFAFSADQPATFSCRVDRKPFRRCRSPKRFRLRRGKHRFQVRAANANGTGPAAGYRFKIVRKKRARRA